MAMSDELKEIIASHLTNRTEVEVVRISHSALDTLYLTSQLEEGAQIYDENNVIRTVNYVPMKLGDESTGQLLKNERTLTMQGINDVIAHYEDRVPSDSTERIKVDVLTYTSDLDGVLSKVAMGPFKYFNKKTVYSAKSNSISMTIATTSTNQSETGRRFDKTVFPTLQGFD